MSIQHQIISIGDQFVRLVPTERAVEQDQSPFSVDDLISQFVAQHGDEPLREANRWVAETLYPEHSARPTIAVLRLRAGLSQRELADLMEVKQPYVARLESGSANPTYQSMKSLAEALRMSVGEVMEAYDATVEANAHEA